jgi:hypothetical protein
MTVVAGIEAVALVAVVALFLWHVRSLERAAAQERRVLADRIQRPELLPVAGAVAWSEPPDREDDGLSTVGKIRIGDEYNLNG